MRVQWAGRLQVVTLYSKSKAFPVIQSSKPSAQLSLLLAARTCPRGPHVFVVAFTVRRAGPAGYGAATHNTTQYKYSFRKDRSEECTRSHRVVHVRHSQTFPTCSTLLSRTHIMLRDERVLGVSCKIEILWCQTADQRRDAQSGLHRLHVHPIPNAKFRLARFSRGMGFCTQGRLKSDPVSDWSNQSCNLHEPLYESVCIPHFYLS